MQLAELSFVCLFAALCVLGSGAQANPYGFRAGWKGWPAE